MATQKKKFRRKNYLINKPLQFVYSGITVYLLLIGIIIVGIATYYITLNTILTQLEAQGGLVQAYEIVRSINGLLAQRIGILFLIVMVVAFVLAVFYLHRIAGPVYRIEKTLNEIAEGKKVEPVHLRKKDFFKSLAEALNRVIGIVQKTEDTR
jgi:methyl-accepting chemotaxis protein